MGKKLSQASLKISKNDKKQLNSLIKVLRPKVYITDSSSFKRLVQELTGNGTTTVSSPPPTTPPQMVEKVSVVDIEDHGEPDSSVEAISFDASIDSFEICNQECYPEDLLQEYNQMYWDDIISDISMNRPMDLLAHQDLESWPLDIEPYPFCYGYSQIQQEVSIYDYELSGLIS